MSPGAVEVGGEVIIEVEGGSTTAARRGGSAGTAVAATWPPAAGNGSAGSYFPQGSDLIRQQLATSTKSLKCFRKSAPRIGKLTAALKNCQLNLVPSRMMDAQW
jgi:hypothetical protein